MFLAIKELLYEKSRFVLIVAVIALVGYLVYFLTALAFGLAASYSNGIDKWQASGIVLTAKANKSISRSLMPASNLTQVDAPEKAGLGVSAAIAEVEEGREVALFGIDLKSFIAPSLTSGELPQYPFEVIVSSELQGEELLLGSTINLSELDQELKVVGFTDKATFQTSPIIYLSLSDWRQATSQIAGMTSMRDNTTINAIVTRGQSSQISIVNDQLAWQSIDSFISELPGYSAQVATFSLMIGSLILIAAFVLTIFIYILTLQKKPMFGILKAEGVPSSYIGKSVIAQTLILSVVGLVVGASLALATGMALNGTVPFLVEPLIFIGIAALFIVCALLGGVVSVRTVVKIDPVEAIG